MPKTINFKLSKRLNEGGYLDNIETEYEYNIHGEIITNIGNYTTISYQTLTLEEVMDFIPEGVILEKHKNNLFTIRYEKDGKTYGIYGRFKKMIAYEKMLEYLLDKNHI